MIKTRFAPSPTGYIHIGNLRSAIFPYLIARQNHGHFILRIEDTDQARFVDGATQLIMETLKWIGLDWDEGPDLGGPHAPYTQSQRKAVYERYAKKLLASGRAYADPTTKAELESFHQDATQKKQAFLFRHYRPQVTPPWKPGLAIRFKAEPKAYQYHDEIFGDLKMGPETQDDFILIKSDGLPTYNFAHIVDDYDMGVTHVLRGQEYLPSMGNYLALYEALEIPRPIFVHLPHILAPSGHKKLGKRDGAKSAVEYRDGGILPEAMLNFLACLGWNDGSQQEIFTKAELIEKFDLHRIQRAGARFDENKLLWLNGQWLRRLFKEDARALFLRSANFWPASANSFDSSYRFQVFSIIYDRLKTFADLGTMTDYFFSEPKVNLTLITGNKMLKKLSPQDLSGLIRDSIAALAQIDETNWQSAAINDVLNTLLTKSGQKPGVLFGLLRLAVSFAPFSPALPDTFAVLGKKCVLARLQTCHDHLLEA